MNIRGMVRHGSEQPLAKLDEIDVALMRRLYTQGSEISDLAVRFAVSLSCVTSALRGHTWKHVPAPVAIRSRRRTHH